MHYIKLREARLATAVGGSCLLQQAAHSRPRALQCPNLPPQPWRQCNAAVAVGLVPCPGAAAPIAQGGSRQLAAVPPKGRARQQRHPALALAGIAANR